MKYLICDVCQKKLDNPIANRTYWHIKDKDICEACKDTMEWKLRPVVRGHFPFDTEWYERTVTGMIASACEAGQF